jgi:hypothetical protein
MNFSISPSLQTQYHKSLSGQRQRYSLELTLEASFDVCSECHCLFGTASMFAESYLANRCSFLYHGLENHALEELVGHAQQ